MRTTILILTALTLALAGLVIDQGTAAPRQGQAAGMGDTNCDDTINSIDALFILQWDAGLLGDLQCQGNADMNADGTVNLFDYDLFQACVTGPGGGPVSPDCACFDFNDDDDVDLLDFAAFQVSFTG